MGLTEPRFCPKSVSPRKPTATGPDQTAYGRSYAVTELASAEYARLPPIDLDSLHVTLTSPLPSTETTRSSHQSISTISVLCPTELRIPAAPFKPTKRIGGRSACFAYSSFSVFRSQWS